MDMLLYIYLRVVFSRLGQVQMHILYAFLHAFEGPLHVLNCVDYFRHMKSTNESVTSMRSEKILYTKRRYYA